ncbi:ABC-F family ATP-binding cassette domain-containing protein [Rhodospirillum centenum]|uniref:ABC-F family ATP-binding cassette domain-containing protein n=1 Tax=Rhodospirillum centenum TaxID=34018 RepID=UPI000A00B1DC|nr:ABC-F family ATP-binding cassette domain-containing protein [Rhodospirillum centenum]
MPAPGPVAARLVAEHVDFAFSPDRPLFSGLSLSLGAERVGLVGANGTGKSTLLRLLRGELRPTAGGIGRHGRLLYLAQRPDPDATVAEALGVAGRLAALSRIEAGGTDPADFETVGTDGWDLPSRMREALTRAGVPGLEAGRRLGSLSGGQATRVRLARIGLEAPDLLLLDEPSNDLDADGRSALYDLVRGWSGGLLVVSHDRTLLALMDRILELSSLGLRSYGGNHAAYRAAKAAEVAVAERRLSDAEKEAGRTARAAQEARERAARRARTGKARADGSQAPMELAKMRRDADASHSRRQRLADRQAADTAEALDAARADLERRRTLALTLPPTGLPAGKLVLRLEEVRAGWSGRPVLRGVSLTLTGPERVAVTGPNGAGKSTLLAVAAGRLSPQGGTVQRGVADIALLDQRLGDLRSGETVLQAFRRLNPDLTEHEARAALATFQFRNDAALALVEDLSGGQRLRAALAAVLGARHPPRLLLLDEPTNHLDLESLDALEQALRGYDGALLVVSHDAEFLRAIGTTRELRLPPPIPPADSGSGAGCGDCPPSP